MVVKAIKGGFRIRNVGFHCAGITVSWCKNIHLKQQFHYINQSLPIQVKFSIFTGIFTINIWIISAYYSISIFWLLVPQKATQCHKQILYIICHKILFIYHLIPWLDKIDIIHIRLNTLSIITLSFWHFHNRKKDIPCPVKLTGLECPFSSN